MADTVNQAPPSEGFWKRFFTRTLPHDWRAGLGSLMFFAMIVLVVWQGVNEGNRMETYAAQYDARSIQRGAGLFYDNCRPCHGADGSGIEGVAPALNTPDLFSGARTAEMGFAGSIYDFVQLTIAAGRPVRSGDWPQPMPTWSQEYGGPLRPDQVRDLTNYVMNWGCQYDPECVVDAAELTPVATVAATAEGPAAEVVCPEGADCAPLDTLPAGDAARGETLFLGTEPAPDGQALGCQACHSLDGSTGVGPSMQGISGRVPDGYASVEEYVYSSIVHPSEHIREGFADVMPKTFGQRLDAQSLADLIAFISQQ